jgi:hypothetical protein
MLTRPTPPAHHCEPGRLFASAPDLGEVPFGVLGSARPEPTMEPRTRGAVVASAG